MTAAELLRELHRRGVRITAHDGRFRCEAPRGTITPDLVEAMRQHKAELMRLLARLEHVPTVPTAYRILVDGRAVAEAHTKDEAVIAFDKTIHDIGPTENQVVVELVDGEGKKLRVGFLPPWRGNRAVAP
ncbi:MAG: hypothetical protein KM310_10780 [Clostridiales bacterium]|nr:hypothetical protein [Clostridiales bacterium]